jgi:tetratricopeptide (TPR) repeat protein
MSARNPETLRDEAIALHMRGSLSDAEPLYQESLRQRPDNFQTLLMYGLLTAQTGRLEQAAELFRRAIRIDGNSPVAHNNLGSVLAELKLYEQAVVSFEKAVRLAPQYAEAHSSRGAALGCLKRYEQALASHERAIELQPHSAFAHSNRGNVLLQLQRHEDALASFDTSVGLRPVDAELHTNRGQCLMQMGRYEEAISCFDTCIRLSPNNPEAHYSKGLALLTLGDPERGWPLHEWRTHKGRALPTRAPHLPCPLWRGQESLHGKTLFLHWEQGLGDTIQFCRYAKLAQERGARVVLEVQPVLAPLLRCLGAGIEIATDLESAHGCDCYSPLMSLPLAFKSDLATIPHATRYLTGDPTRVARCRSELGSDSMPLVGLVWRGNPLQANDQRRSIELAQLSRYLPQHARYLRLQTELSEVDREVLRSHSWLGQLLRPPGDFSDTAALIECLDVVITVDTSIAHLSGALGRKTWLLLPYAPDWRWLLGREDSPWYRSVRLYRQDRAGSWDGPLGRIEEALSAVKSRGG